MYDYGLIAIFMRFKYLQYFLAESGESREYTRICRRDSGCGNRVAPASTDQSVATGCHGERVYPSGDWSLTQQRHSVWKRTLVCRRWTRLNCQTGGTKSYSGTCILVDCCTFHTQALIYTIFSGVQRVAKKLSVCIFHILILIGVRDIKDRIGYSV